MIRTHLWGPLHGCARPRLRRARAAAGARPRPSRARPALPPLTTRAIRARPRAAVRSCPPSSAPAGCPGPSAGRAKHWRGAVRVRRPLVLERVRDHVPLGRLPDGPAGRRRVHGQELPGVFDAERIGRERGRLRLAGDLGRIRRGPHPLFGRGPNLCFAAPLMDRPDLASALIERDRRQVVRAPLR